MFFTSIRSGSSANAKALFLALIFIGLAGVSCQKKELKEPTEVDVGFSVKNEDPSLQDQGQGKGPSIDLETKNIGELSIQEVRVIGRRKEGEDVDFSREESIDLPIKEVQNGPKVRFDLPQGTYENIELRLKLANDGNGAIRYEGRRIEKPVHGPSQATPFRLIIEDEKTIECQVDPSNGKYPVELRNGDPRRIEVKLRTEKWFQDVPPGLWKKADVDPKGGQPMIPVHAGNNSSIHSKVLKRIHKSFKSSIL